MRVELFFIYLRVVSEMNSDIPFLSVYHCATRISMQAPNDFLRINYHQQSEVPATNPPVYFKYDLTMKILIYLFRRGKMTSSRHGNFY